MSDKILLLTNARNEYTRLSKERDDLMTKGLTATLTKEEWTQLGTLNDQCDEAEAQVQIALKSIDSSNKTQTFMTNAQPEAEVVVTGMTHNRGDETTIDLQTKQVIDQGGFGLVSEAQWKKLSAPAYMDAFNAMIRLSYETKGNPHRKMDNLQIKALEEGLDPQGGYLIPPQYILRLISRLPAPTRVQSKVMTWTTGKDKITMPRLNYSESTETFTTPFRVTWTGENPASSTVHRVNDTDLFGMMTIDVYTAMLSGVLTKDMVEDTDFPILSWIADKFGETIMLLRDEMILNGSGINQPYGMTLNPDGTGQLTSVLSGTANNISADAIRGMPYEVAEQYINDNTCWVMNRKSAGKTIALFKDGENRYMWANGSYDDKLAQRGPDTLDGYPVAYSTFMPNVGNGAYPIIFGDLAGYYLVNRVGLAITFYHDSAYDQLNQIGIGGRLRFGGKLAEPWRMRLLKSDDA